MNSFIVLFLLYDETSVTNHLVRLYPIVFIRVYVEFYTIFDLQSDKQVVLRKIIKYKI